MLKKLLFLVVLAIAVPAVAPVFDNPMPCPWGPPQCPAKPGGTLR